jgi:hypothetical protein
MKKDIIELTIFHWSLKDLLFFLVKQKLWIFQDNCKHFNGLKKVYLVNFAALLWILLTIL